MGILGDVGPLLSHPPIQDHASGLSADGIGTLVPGRLGYADNSPHRRPHAVISMATHHNSARPLTHPRMAVGSVVAACYPGNRFGLGVLETQQSADSDAPRGPREPKDAFASAVYAQTKAEQAPAHQNRQGPHICRPASSGLRLM